MEEIEVEIEDATTKEKMMIKESRPKALSARFIMKAISLFNTKVARSWNKFDSFLEVFHQLAQQSPVALEYFFSIHFIKYAGDFILGKKSPLLKADENRTQMGSSWSQPNFGPLI